VKDPPGGYLLSTPTRPPSVLGHPAHGRSTLDDRSPMTVPHRGENRIVTRPGQRRHDRRIVELAEVGVLYRLFCPRQTTLEAAAAPSRP
jgi:hypothetical protein